MDLDLYNNETFESIKHIDENNNEYWYARELQKVLGYKEWRKFEGVINRAKDACVYSNSMVLEHFVGADKLSNRANNAEVLISDYKLTRYACYLIAQNGDSRKTVIAQAQTYFAIQTRRQELSDMEYQNLPEIEKRLYQRKITKEGNYTLQLVASKAGVKNMDKFQGYVFQNVEITKNGKIEGETNAYNTHYEVGKKVRDTIKELGGTMPEELPTPKRSLKELKKESRQELIK